MGDMNNKKAYVIIECTYNSVGVMVTHCSKVFSDFKLAINYYHKKISEDNRGEDVWYGIQECDFVKKDFDKIGKIKSLKAVEDNNKLCQLMKELYKKTESYLVGEKKGFKELGWHEKAAEFDNLLIRINTAIGESEE